MAKDKRQKIRKPPQEIADAQYDLNRACVRGESEETIAKLRETLSVAKAKHNWED